MDEVVVDEEVPIPTQEQIGVPLTTDAAQYEFDLRLLYEGLGQTRARLSSAKLSYHLSKSGVPGAAKHLEQQKADIMRVEHEMLVLIELIRKAEESHEPMPMPSPIEIAMEVP